MRSMFAVAGARPGFICRLLTTPRARESFRERACPTGQYVLTVRTPMGRDAALRRSPPACSGRSGLFRELVQSCSGAAERGADSERAVPTSLNAYAGQAKNQIFAVRKAIALHRTARGRDNALRVSCASRAMQFFGRAEWFLFDPFLRGCIAFRHGTGSEPKPVDACALWSSARRHCARSVVLCGLVAEALSDCCLVAGSDHHGLLPDWLERPRAGVAHRGRIHQFHSADRLALRRFGRHSHQREGRSNTAGQRRLSVHRRSSGQPLWHNRRLDALDPSMAADEQIPNHCASRRLLYIYRVKRRRLPHADRRSTAVSRLPARHSILVGRPTLLAHLGCWPERAVGDVLSGRSEQLSACPETDSRKARRAARCLAV